MLLLLLLLNCAPNPQDSFQLSTCKPSSSGYLLRDVCGTQYHFKPPCLSSWGPCWHIIVYNVNRWELIVGWWPCLYDHSACHRHWKVLCSGSSPWKQRKTNKSQTQGLWYSSISFFNHSAYFSRERQRRSRDLTFSAFAVCRPPFQCEGNIFPVWRKRENLSICSAIVPTISSF